MADSTSIELTIAKATPADLSGALELASILDNLDRGYYPSRESDEDAPLYFDDDNVEHLQYLYQRIRDIAERASLFRVAFGMACLLDEKNALVDPAVDHLAIHPRIKDALERFTENGDG